MIRLLRINPEKNERRYYKLSIQHGLFGNTALIREWGRIGQSGSAMTQWFDNGDDAICELEKLQAQKLRKGYG